MGGGASSRCKQCGSKQKRPNPKRDAWVWAPTSLRDGDSARRTAAATKRQRVLMQPSLTRLAAAAAPHRSGQASPDQSTGAFGTRGGALSTLQATVAPAQAAAAVSFRQLQAASRPVRARKGVRLRARKPIAAQLPRGAGGVWHCGHSGRQGASSAKWNTPGLHKPGLGRMPIVTTQDSRSGEDNHFVVSGSHLRHGPPRWDAPAVAVEARLPVRRHLQIIDQIIRS